MIRPRRHLKNNCHICQLLLIFVFLNPGVESAYALDTQAIEYQFDLTSAGQSPLSLPSDVAVSADGRIYVVDGGNNRVVVYASDGNYLATIGSKGSKTGQFEQPVGIGIDKKGHVYVADTGNHRLQIFDAAGHFLKQIKLRDDNKNIRPIDVAVSPNMDTIYITGNNNHKIMRYSIEGKKLKSWGKQGNNPGEFRYPATITVGKDGDVYVVDVLNSRVQIFESSGKLRIIAGSWGVLPGQLFRPKGVALDKNGNIFVSDSYLGVIEVFNNKTSFTHVLGSNGIAKKFVTPAGIFIDSRDRLYVTQMLENKVSVYELE